MALESLLSMTGDSDMNVVTPWLDRLQLQQERRQEVLPPSVSDKVLGATGGSDSSSDSSPSPQSSQSFSSVLSANATSFAPKRVSDTTTKAKRKGKENVMNLDLDPDLEKQLKRLQNPAVKLMVLLRGLPGSGKSVLADHLAKYYEGHVVSADSYFTKSGFYQFDANLLGAAHEWCQKRAEDWARINSRLIIVDNTNLEDWEMMPYAHVANRHGYQLVLAEPKTAWKYTPSTLSKKNSHQVQQKSIERMLLRFDRMITAPKLMSRAQAKDWSRENSSFLQTNGLTLNPNVPQTTLAATRASADTESLVASSRLPPQTFSPPNPLDLKAGEREASQSDMDISPVTSDDDVLIIPPEEATTEPVTLRDRIKAGAAMIGNGSTDWTLPAFPADATPLRKVKAKSVTVRDSSAQTAVHDFAELELGERLVCLNDDQDPERSRRFDLIIGKEYKQDVLAGAVVTMDKGTTISSEDVGDMTFDQKVQFLLDEFPLATREHIVEVLNACQLNHTFAKAILNGFDDEHFDELVVEESEDEENGTIEEREPEPKLRLELDVGLAAALEEKFGPIPGEAFDNLHLDLSDSLARSLYDAWYQATVGHAPPVVPKPAKKTPVPKKSPKKTRNTLLKSAPQSSLQEIMQYEEAMELSKQEQRSAAQTYELKMQLAKKQQLYRQFPGAPEEALDAVLEVNNYDVVETAIQIRLSTRNSGCTSEVQYLQALKKKGHRMFPPTAECQPKELRIPLNIPPSKSLMAKSLPELRDEMLALYKVKGAQMEKARKCLTNRQYMVATYYRQEAEDLDRRIEKLSQTIVIKSLEVQGDGNVLDLHFLHVREAICTLKFFLELKRKQLKESGIRCNFVEVITGYGKGGTVPKIKPAVEEFLRSKGYVFVPKNEGCFMVTLNKNSRH